MRCSDAHRMVVTEGYPVYGTRVGGGFRRSRELAHHLATCEICRETAENYGRDADLIRRAALRLPIDPDFTPAVMRRIRSS